MISNLFFDNDCLSSFLWINKQDIMIKLFSKRIVVPQSVIDEIQRVPHIYARLEALIVSGEVLVEDIDTGTDEAKFFDQMTVNPESGYIRIGDGEAAAISMARHRSGIVASNNLRDVTRYVKKYNLELVTTSDILKLALEQNIITQEAGDIIWENMLKKRRKLGPWRSFTAFLNSK